MKLKRRLTAMVCSVTVSLAAIPYFAVPTAAADNYQTRDPFFNFNSGYNYYTSEHFQFIWGNSGDAGQVTQSFLEANANSLETCWDIYVNKLGMTECAESVETYLRDGNKYKLNVYISGTGLSGMADDWAYMSWDREGYPYLFCCTGAMRADPPSWVMPHEFGHAITAHQLGWNNNKYSNTWWEALGNWFREQWLYEVSDQYGWTDNAYDGGYGTDFFETYLKNLCFTSPFGRDYYSAWVFLQYLTENPDNLEGYGANFVRTLLQKGNADEYPFTMINRLAPADMKETLGHFAKRMATLDFEQQTAYRKRLDMLLSQGAWNWQQIYTMLEKVDGTANTYSVPTERAPQATGLNIVPLDITGDKITVTLNGKSELDGADWRGCIVIEDSSRKSYYSDLIKNGETVSLSVPANATAAYLTVIAAPDESLYNPSGLHWHNDSDEFGETKQPFSSKNRYPYEVTIDGAGIKSRPLNMNGSRHANGGGFVASSAHVDASVYVGPNAAVIGNATVTGDAVIDGYAMIAENAKISGNAYVGDYAMVMGRATVTDNAKVLESACIWDTYTVKDNAVVKGVAFCMANGSASGQAILDGDYYDDGSNSATKGTCCGWYGTQTYLDARPYTDGLYAAYDFDSDSSAIAKERYNTTYAVNQGAAWEAERTSAKGVMTFDGKSSYLDVDDSFAYFRDGAEYQFATLWRGGAANQKLFYFGDSDTYLYFTPKDDSGEAALVYKDSTATYRIPVGSANAFQAGKWVTLRVQIGSQGRVTLDFGDGSKISTEANIPTMDGLLKAMSGDGAVSVIGKGLDGDYYNGSVDYARVFFKSVSDDLPYNYVGGEDIFDDPIVTTTTTTTTEITTTTTTSALSGFYRGDVDCNDEVELQDAVLLAKAIAGLDNLGISAQGMQNSDCNLNGTIAEPSDLTVLLQFLSGLAVW